MKTNETKRMIWTSDLYFNEESIKDWWREQCESEADAADYRDLCAKMGIDADKLTTAQITALETLVPAYREKLMEREPDMDLWAEQNADWLDDERANLDMPLCGYVMGMQDLGKRTSTGLRYKLSQFGRNLNAFLCGECDFAEFYADDYNMWGNFSRCRDDLMMYRFATYEQKERLWRLAEDFKLTPKNFLSNTTSLLPYVASVYGWPLRNCKQREKAERIAEEERKRHERRNAA